MDRITDFLERRGRDGLFKEAGIMVPPEENNTAFPFGTAADKGAHKRSRIATCNVCFDDVSQLSDVSTMDCGHCFCNDCEYLHASAAPFQ
jgi:ariadne-1